MPHAIVWVDLPVRDLDHAIRFYAAVLGRPVNREGGPGFQFAVLPHEGNEVGGCLVPAGGELMQPSMDGPLVYLDADGRLAEAVAAAQAQGGQLLMAPHKIGPHGWRAVVADGQGNRVALHSRTHQDSPAGGGRG